MFTEAEALVEALTATRQGAIALETELESLSERAHATRLRIGSAVDALGADLSTLREAARESHALREARAEESEEARARVLACEAEVLSFGAAARLVQPSLPLANAYRMLAVSMESWAERQRVVDRSSSEHAKRVKAQSDLAFQIDELRGALAENEIEAAASTERLGKQLEASWDKEQELEAAAMRALARLEAGNAKEPT